MNPESEQLARLLALARIVAKECRHLAGTDARLFGHPFTPERAERLGFIPDADEWAAMRRLRNQMVHEYEEDPAILIDALEAGHTHTRTLLDAAAAMLDEIDRRGWKPETSA